jgi:hypothetical protein
MLQSFLAELKRAIVAEIEADNRTMRERVLAAKSEEG